MLARARVRGRWERRESQTPAEVVLEAVCRFAFGACGGCGLDARDQRGVFGWDGAGADEMAEGVDVEGCWLWGIVGQGGEW